MDKTTDLLDAALGYARRGIAVMPLHTPGYGGSGKADADARMRGVPVAADGIGVGCSCSAALCDNPGKHPRLRHGVLDASRDASQIKRWWQRWPLANIGLRTGEVMDVCDVDSPAGLKALRQVLGELPRGPVVRTGSGWHLWFQPSGYGNRVGLVPAVDWRGIGGSIIAPPSLHHSGRRYQWLHYSRGFLPPCPAELVDLLRPPPLPPRPVHEITDPDSYAKRAVQRWVTEVETTVPGGRNHALNRAAFSLGKLVASGYLDEGLVWTQLREAARKAGLNEPEIRRTIASGLRAGIGRR